MKELPDIQHRLLNNLSKLKLSDQDLVVHQELTWKGPLTCIPLLLTVILHLLSWPPHDA